MMLSGWAGGFAAPGCIASVGAIATLALPFSGAFIAGSFVAKSFVAKSFVAKSFVVESFAAMSMAMLLSERFRRCALASAAGCAGARILYPASSRALPTITQGLTQLGAEVHQVEAYRTDAAPLDTEDCHAWIDREAIGAVTFASPSAVIELERALGAVHFAHLLAQAEVIAIGPTTARALRIASTPIIPNGSGQREGTTTRRARS